MKDKKYRSVTDFGNLLMRLNQEVPNIGINDEGKAEAIFIETRELIKKHFGEEHGFYKDYLRIRSLKGMYTFQLQSLVPVIETIANIAKSDYLQEVEEYQKEIESDLEKNKGSRIPWKKLDKLERKYRQKEPLLTRIKRINLSIPWFDFDGHTAKVIFLIILGIALCSVPFFIPVVPDWLGYVAGVTVAIIGTLFTMSRNK